MLKFLVYVREFAEDLPEPTSRTWITGGATAIAIAIAIAVVLAIG